MKDTILKYSKAQDLMTTAGFTRCEIEEDGQKFEVYAIGKGLSVQTLKGIRLDLQCAFKAY